MLDSAESVIRGKLDDGEELLWSGQPRQGLLLQPADALLIPFSLLWAGFAFYWEYEVVRTHQFWVLQLWGIPFVVVGLYLVAGRFFVDAYMRGKTYYGVSDTRIVITSGQTTNSIALSDLKSVLLVSKPDKSGTLVFGPPNLPPPRSTIAYFQPSRGPQYPMFAMIPDAQSLYDMIQAHRNASAVQTS